MAVFILIGDFPTHRARMTEVYLRISQAGIASISCSRFFLAQTPEGFEDISKNERRADYEASSSMETGRPSPPRDRFHEVGPQAAPGPQAQGLHPQKGGEKL